MAKASGYSLRKQEMPIVLGMVARGDRDHEIACWFGVNQGRIAEVKNGKFGSFEAAPAHQLPPSGPPGIKGRRARQALENALGSLENGDTEKAKATIKDAIAKFDANEP